MLAALVDTNALLRTVAAASIAGIGIAFIFSFAILGAARVVEYGRSGRPVAAGAFGILGVYRGHWRQRAKRAFSKMFD